MKRMRLAHAGHAFAFVGFVPSIVGSFFTLLLALALTSPVLAAKPDTLQVRYLMRWW